MKTCCVLRSVVEVLTQLNQVQRPRSHHRPSSLQLLGIASKSSTKPLHHAANTANGGSSSASKSTFTDLRPKLMVAATVV